MRTIPLIAQAVLVGNKCDLDDDRVVSYNDGLQLAEDIQLPFFEASAKENINVRCEFENDFREDERLPLNE